MRTAVGQGFTGAGDRTTASPARAAALRRFGRFALLRLLGKGERTMAWQVADPRDGRDLLLALPRKPPSDAARLEQWLHAAQRAGRLQHPHLAAPVEVGAHEGWPFVAYDFHAGATLAETVGSQGLAAAEAAELFVPLLHALAFAHEGGVVHRDPQPYYVILDAGGLARLAGLEVAGDVGNAGGADPGALRARRAAAERDVLCFGVMLHHALSGQRALDEVDVGGAVARLPPLGREIVRLPWSTPRPIPEALRAIANRATDRQERQRYRSARTLARALEGWLQSEGRNDAGPLALLSDRLHAAGVLPSSADAAPQARRLAVMESQRTIELAQVVLDDLALSFELLRQVNAAQSRVAHGGGSGPVLTVRRAIALLGVDGVQRIANALRRWPGPLDENGAAALARLIERVKRAGRVAVALRPAGYDAEVVYLVTLLQNLGRLVVQYHFPEEAHQIRRLMQPVPAEHAGGRGEPGMSEAAASFAVLGADIGAIGHAVARLAGFDDAALQMIRRLPQGTPVRAADHDDDVLRAVASAANEAVDTLAAPPSQQAGELQRVVQRYARVLGGLGLRELQAALQSAPPLGAEAQTPVEAAPVEGAAVDLAGRLGA